MFQNVLKTVVIRFVSFFTVIWHCSAGTDSAAGKWFVNCILFLVRDRTTVFGREIVQISMRPMSSTLPILSAVWALRVTPR